MGNSTDVTPSFLRSIIDYDPETGHMLWLARTPDMFSDSAGCSAEHRCDGFNTQFAGKPAISSVSARGYKAGSIFGKHVYAHRVAWAIHYGQWPEHHIDHINGDKSDNRIANLRDCTQSMNLRNSSAAVTSSSGHRCIYPSGRKWMVRFSLRSGVAKGSRLFVSLDDAIKERDAMAEQLGFTKRHVSGRG